MPHIQDGNEGDKWILSGSLNTIMAYLRVCPAIIELDNGETYFTFILETIMNIFNLKSSIIINSKSMILWEHHFLQSSSQQKKLSEKIWVWNEWLKQISNPFAFVSSLLQQIHSKSRTNWSIAEILSGTVRNRKNQILHNLKRENLHLRFIYNLQSWRIEYIEYLLHFWQGNLITCSSANLKFSQFIFNQPSPPTYMFCSASVRRSRWMG